MQAISGKETRPDSARTQCQTIQPKLLKTPVRDAVNVWLWRKVGGLSRKIQCDHVRSSASIPVRNVDRQS